MANIYVNGIFAGTLTEQVAQQQPEYLFKYLDGYSGDVVSLTMPLSQQQYHYQKFPPFFEGLLPEGFQLEALLKHSKIDRNDYFSQLLQVGNDCIGNVTIHEA